MKKDQMKKTTQMYVQHKVNIFMKQFNMTFDLKTVWLYRHISSAILPLTFHINYDFPILSSTNQRKWPKFN